MNRLAIVLGLLLIASCGGNAAGGGDPTDDSGVGPGGDASGNPDGSATGCTPGITQCTDCIDNDDDGRIDGFDVECISAADNDESSFDTGINGDNKDPEKQDCFFDGNSGKAPMGLDECIYSTCCLYGTCPEDPSCNVTQGCVDFCAPSAPPCCDCFGCCTVCDDEGCATIVTNLAVAPNCDGSTIHDAVKCPTCTLNADCVSAPDPGGCTLCPGQDASDLPEQCGGTQECPDGQSVCQGNADCDANTEFCASGCCVERIIID